MARKLRDRDDARIAHIEHKLTQRWAGVDGERKRSIMLHLLSVGSASPSELEAALPCLPRRAGKFSSASSFYGLMGQLVEEGMVTRLGHPYNRRYAATDHALTVIM